MEIPTNTFDNYPDWVLEKWQGIADLLAEIIDIPAALIMKSDNEFIEVFTSSHSKNNPYSVGNKEKSYGLYCETVIKTQNKLLVPNATKDKAWSQNPDIKLGMIAYLGFPLNFPNGQPFGTLCVLDNKERPFSLLNEKLILQFKSVIELDLALIQSFDLNTKQLAANEIQEINDRKQTEEALKEIELKYHSLIENSSDAIFCVDENGEYKFVNQLFASTFGKSTDYFIGKTFWDVYDKEHADHRYEATKRMFKSGESESLEVEVPLPDKTLYFLATTNPIKDETGKVVLNLTHAADITELKKIEKALVESHQFNSQIINSQQIGIIVFDREQRYRVWNPFMENLTATPASQVIGKHISELFPFLTDIGIAAKVEKALLGEYPSDGGFPFNFIDSEISGWSSYVISPLIGVGGEIIGVIVNVYDITLSKLAEEKIKKSENQLANAIEIAKLGPWEYDIVSDTFTFNDHFYAVFRTTVELEGGYTMNSAQYTKRFVHVDDITLVGIEIQKAIEATDPNFNRNIEHRCIYADDEIGYINVHFYIIKDAQGRTVKTYGVNQDITERKKNEQRILKHSNELATLLNISRELAETLNLQSILQLTTDRATELTEMKTSALYLLDGETIRLWATTPPLPILFPEELRNAPLAEHPHIHKTIITGTPLFVYDTATTELTMAERAVTEIRGLRSILYLPLKAGTKVMGALILSSIQKPLSLSEAEINFCNTLANLAALAVVNAQLFDSEQVYATKLREQVAELVQAKEMLKISEQRYRDLFKLANEGLILLTLDGKIAELNQSFADMHGYTVDEMLNMDIKDLDVLRENTFDGRAEVMRRIFDGEVVRFDVEHYHKNGHSLILSNTVSLITIEGKQYFLAFHQDITERKQAESILQDIIDKNPMSIQIVDIEGYTIKVNPSHTALFGAVPPPDFSILNDLQSKSPELEKLIMLAKSGEVVHFPDYYYNVHDVSPEFPDKPVWIHAILFPLKDSTGKFEKLVLMHENITWRKHAEELLLESEQKFREIYNSTNEAILINDALTGQMIDCNQRAVEIYGYANKEEILRGNIVALGSNMEPFTDENVQYKIRKTIEEGNNTFEWLAKRKNGDLFSVEVSLKIAGIGGRKTILSVVRDITERKLAEEKIREKDIQFRKLSANVSDLIFQFTRKPDGSYCVPIASEGIRNIFGCSPEDVLNDFTPISKVIHPDDASRVISDIEYSAEHLTYFSCEFRVQIPGKEIQWIYSRSTPEKLPDGSITWYGFNADITERKRAEEELKQMSARFSLAVRAGGVGVWDYDIVNNNLYWDDHMFALYGINKRDFGGVYDTWRSGLHPEDTARGDAEIQMAISGEKEFDTEFRIVWPDGSIHTIRALGSIQRDVNGQAVRMIGTNWDITEQKKAEQELIAAKENAEENEIKYRQIFDNTFDIMSIYEVTEDRRFKVITFNSAEEKLIGSVENYQNRYIDECIPPELYNQFKQNYDRCIEAEKLIEYEEDISFLNINKTFHTQLIPLKNTEGRIHRIIVISRDITDIKLLNTQLTNQNEKLTLLNLDLTVSKEKAEESDRLKSAFLANMSHEIRTPMNGILGFAEILKEPGLTGEQQHEYIRIIEKAGERMLNIINDIVSISKIESGTMEVSNKESNINHQIEYIYDFFKPEVEDKGLKFSFRNSLPAKVSIIRTDREKLYAILTNLVKNAIKYTQEGSIDFGYLKKGDFLEFYVKDTGIGVPKRRQEAIFERFVQADIEDKMALQGAGLGLAITKSYVEMLGGKIWVDSEEGIGSCFYFTLPYNIASINQTESKKEVTSDITDNIINKLKILIVEDDETSEKLISINITEISNEVIKARNGIEAVEICLNRADIDLILMDIQMPVLNGYEATRQIRQFNKDVVIIAQTSFGLSGDREKAISAGCNEYLTKPISKARLYALIQKYFNL